MTTFRRCSTPNVPCTAPNCNCIENIEPNRSFVWPFPPSDPAKRRELVKANQKQQRRDVANGESAKW